MTHMLCRNKVADFAKWKRGFDSHTAAHREAGLKLVHLWRDLNDSNNVYFLFEVGSMRKARTFISTPQAAQAGKKFGVLDGEVHFIRSAQAGAKVRSRGRKPPGKSRLNQAPKGRKPIQGSFG